MNEVLYDKQALEKEVERATRLLLGGEQELQPGSVARLPPPASVVQILEWTRAGPEQTALLVGVRNSFLIATYSRLVSNVDVLVRRRSDQTLIRRQIMHRGEENVRIQADAKLESWKGKGPFDAILVGDTPEPDGDALRWELAVGGVLLHLEQRPGGFVRPHVTCRSSEQTFETQDYAEISLEADLGTVLRMLELIDEPVLRLATLNCDGGELGPYLVEHGLLPERDLCFAEALIEGYGHASVESLLNDVDIEVVRSMPRTYLQHQGLLPLRHEDEFVVVAVRRGENDWSEIEPAFHPRRVAPYVVSDTDYRRLWMSIDLITARQESESTNPNEHIAESLADFDEDANFVEVETPQRHEHHDEGSQGATLHFNGLLVDAVARRASDIHLEFTRSGPQIRLRIDGGLVPYDGLKLSESEGTRLLNIFKIRAQLDISERRLPQGGSIRVRIHKALYDLRLQTQPTLFGENAVIRILAQDMRVQSIEELGFPPETARTYMRVLQNPSGLVLVVGPTGSGKSTTLYAGLELLSNDGTRKIVTIEDPIEYCLPRIQQSQVNVATGFHFSDAIRSFLRQDPDVMLVGEIRDGETAREAIRASQTGHLVLSTLHCNESTDAVQRLVDLGQDLPSIASELRAVLAQRLARRVCKSCRIEVAPDTELVDVVFPAGIPDDFRTWRGQGCSRCGGTGVHGRVSVVEFLPFGDEMREAMLGGYSTQALRSLAFEHGLVSMRERAVELVKSGIVALEDLPRFLPLHRLGPELTATT
ncbi:MAG: Flp pilus assembly complex ATPase component TadA [Planctomycetes bacterium]|nr:Flp pilus assembly complex ATPase component TadA [Planctomycetota bacterium]